MSEIEHKVRKELFENLGELLEKFEREGYVDEALKLRSFVAEFGFKYIGAVRKMYFVLSRTEIPCVDNSPHEIAICDYSGSPFCFKCNHWVWYLLGKRYGNATGKREVRRIQ